MGDMDIDFRVLEAITDRFSDEQKVGSGRYCDVYEGMYNGEEIVVKRLHPLQGISDKAFDSKFRNLSKVEHKNVVWLLGHCCYQRANHTCVTEDGELVFVGGKERLLCYEYMKGGSLEKHIGDAYCRFDWHTCYKIIKGTCDGLNHLHGAHNKPIFHLDLKLSNILLDKNMTAKIADLGLSKLYTSTETHKTQRVKVKGTFGYMPPEYIDGGYISNKYDVFSLGVIILKIITGNKGHYRYSEISPEQFSKNAIENWEKRLHQRSRYSSHKKDILQVKKCIEIALKCVEKDRYKRPNIKDIVHELEELEAKIKDMSLYSDMSRYLIGQEAINAMKSAEAPTMSYLTGSMNSLVDKLTEPKYFLTFGKLHEDLVNLKKDYFNKLVGNGQGVVNLQVKVWIKQVRELVFDIEDWIDGKLRTVMWDPTMIEEKIEEFKTVIEEARIRCIRYDLLIKSPTHGDDVVSVTPSKVAVVDSPLILGDKICSLVGLDIPKEMLKKHFLDERKKLKVVSILGKGGLGKTTLAKELHGELQANFSCRAFVYIGRNPSVRTILVHILHQTMSSSDRKVYFKPPPKRDDDDFLPPQEHEHEVILEKHLNEQQVIALLWGHLIKKRYLIILDGIWSIRYWRAISGALPDNNLGSRILTTTRIMDVAESCSSGRIDVIHHMETLSEVESIRLFSGEAGRPADDKILKMCGGIPLAIILAAGARNCEELGGPKMPGNTTLFSLNQYSTPEGMAKILHMIYADLSLHVRSCFLYLSIFPEGYTIKKYRLIQLWGAEGFIPEEQLWKTGERYLNELTSRRLIQPVFKDDDYEALGYTVHGVILDFVRSLSREENFAAMASELSSGSFSVNTIRRFCVDCSDEDEAGVVASSRVHLSSMRSLTVFRDVPSYSPTEIPPSTSENPPPPSVPLNLVTNFRLTKVLDILSDFKLIRVLDLEDTHNLENQHLIGIGGLVLLRYLGIGGTRIDQLPEEIGQLMHLETLDLRLNRLPASIVNLENLKYLRLDMYFSGKGMTQGLQELDKVTNLLRYGSPLRSLGLTLDAGYLTRTDQRSVASFIEEVSRSNLQYLYLHFSFGDDELLQLLVDSWKEVTPPLAARFEPRKFELIMSGINIYGVPPETASLLHLTHLRINFFYVDDQVLGILGGLPKLVRLNLSSKYGPSHLAGGCTIKRDVFPCLKAAFFTGQMRLVFTRRAMPQLQMLSFCTGKGHFCSGIRRLICLTRVRVVINCDGATVFEVVAWETRIREQVSRNPNKPALEFIREKEETMSHVSRHRSNGVSTDLIMYSPSSTGGIKPLQTTQTCV